MASSRSGSMPRTSRASGRCSRSSTSGPPIASSPGSAGTRTGRARTSGRCCSGCSTMRARSTTSGVTSSFTWDKRAALTEELAPLRENALEHHPWREWAEWATTGDADASGPAAARRDLALEPRQGPVVGAASHRTRRGGRLRPPPGRPVPARDDVQALAPGQATRGLPLRPARGERALPAGEHLRDRGLRWPSVSVSSAVVGSAASISRPSSGWVGPSSSVSSRGRPRPGTRSPPAGVAPATTTSTRCSPRPSPRSSTWPCRRTGQWRSASGWSRPGSRS